MPAQLTPPSSVSGSPQSGQAAGEFQKPRSRDCPRWGQVLSSLKVYSFRKEPRRTHLADHRDRCG